MGPNDDLFAVITGILGVLSRYINNESVQILLLKYTPPGSDVDSEGPPQPGLLGRYVILGQHRQKSREESLDEAKRAIGRRAPL